MFKTHLFASVTFLIAASIGNADSFSTPQSETAHQVSPQTVQNADLWCTPFDAPLNVTRYFDLPFYYAAGHRGIDIAKQPASAPVRAPAGGTVSFVGKVVDRHVISVQVSPELVYSIEPVATDLQVGDRVTRCQPLGTVEGAGHTAAAAIHIGVRKNDDYINPIRFFRRKPVLLPLH
ncbi:M23 family metallopeptidase [Canibacter zhoujuaniae]|uniref:M23 family metallopeptidase n=1 Tax=Canibacter zhoujuaniae TaxID=2708343 RepID=UPI001423D19D|nr:M23 family metallopeptidase [Canibacter zhoujuaniae]